VNTVELLAAVLFAVLGIRSLVYWLRRPIESVARRDLLLYALFVAARAGLWFALTGLFLLFASVEGRGRAFIDEAARFNWYFIVLAVPAALQFVTGFLLGRPPSPSPPDGDRGA
jgi:hypothetical protein